MTVISSMISQLRGQAGKAADDTTFKAPRKLIGLLKAAAPSVAGGLTKRYLGIDPVAIMNAADDGDVEEIKDENGNTVDMGAAASKMVQHLISEHDSKATAIESLKNNVEQWVAAVIGKDQAKIDNETKRTYPAFIFIDELDRCRPNYAVEMLETIKHIFNIPGVTFVVATDTDQLQHTVKAVYGEGFDAKVYLGRFFNSRFSLKSPSLEGLLEVHCRTEFLDKSYLDDVGVTIWPHCETPQETLKNIATIAEALELSPRSAIQIAERIIATISNATKGAKLDVLMLTLLLCIREKDETLYRQVINGNFHELDVKGKDISFIEHLCSLYKLSDDNSYFTILQTFEPTDITDYFYRSHAGTVKNTYQSKVYKCGLEKYIETIFSSYFGMTSGIYTAGGFSFHDSDEEITTNQRMEKELLNLSSVKHNSDRIFDIGFAWLEYTRLLALGEKYTPAYYKDLVELASALDWIDSDNEE